MHKIKITVLMPCYNAADFLEEAVQSVLSQTFSDFELLVVDDGSTDSSRQIVKNFKDPRIVLIEQPHRGIAAALNHGLQAASAPYIARFDADDICYPQRLETQYRHMLANPEIAVLGSAADYIDSGGRYIFTYRPRALAHADISQLPLAACPFIHASVMYKKDVVDLYKYHVHAHSFEDHLLWRRLMPDYRMENLPAPLIQVRLNPGSVTMDEKKRPPGFHRIKLKALQQKDISAEEGCQLLQILREQNSSQEKQGAYNSLLGKKFLWNNYEPVKAREHLRKAISLNRFDWRDYILLVASYLPKSVITNFYALLTLKR